jgi:hypothetical protein
MIKGVLVDTEAKQELQEELWTLEKQLHRQVEYLTNKNMRGPKGDLSPQQLATFFYGDLKLPVILSKEKRPTCDDDTMSTWTRWERS